MNEDILKGSWRELKGSVKQKWGKLTDNDLVEIKGEDEKLLGRLQRQYGYIRDKAERGYNDTVELATIVSNISRMMKKTESMAIPFIARYGKPLLAKNQENKMPLLEKKPESYTDQYSDSRLRRRNTHLISQ